MKTTLNIAAKLALLVFLSIDFEDKTCVQTPYQKFGLISLMAGLPYLINCRFFQWL